MRPRSRPAARRSSAATALAALLQTLAAAPLLGALFEFGLDDARVSFMGGSGTTDSGTVHSAVAYDALRGRFLVVWSGHESSVRGDAGFGLFAQLVSPSGARIGPRRTLFEGSSFSPPDVVYNPVRDEFYLVHDAPHAQGADVLGHRLDGDTALPLAPPARLQIAVRFGLAPAVGWNPVRDEYLVAWSGDTAAEGVEIVVQRISGADGGELGVDDRVITRFGASGDPAYAAMVPRVVHDPERDEYLVAFVATPDEGPGAISDHFEVYAQPLAGATAAPIGLSPRRVSQMGRPDDPLSSAFRCDVAFDSTLQQYLLVWEGHRNEPESSPFETEIYSQRLDAATLSEIGIDDLRLTAVGEPGDSSQAARSARLAYDPAAARFVLVATATFAVDATLDSEVLALEIDPESGEPTGPAAIVSRTGEDRRTTRRAFEAVLAVAPAGRETLVVWSGEGDDSEMVDDEREIFTQAIRAGALFVDGFESGSTAAWSGTAPRIAPLQAPKSEPEAPPPAGGG